jgi:hypothetical protein
MHALCDVVVNAWELREGPVVFTTVDKNGMPNSIYIKSIALSENHRFVIADNYLHKTKQNIEQGSAAVVLFITREGKAYQIKGDITYHTQGGVFDFMKSWNPTRHPGVGAVEIDPQEVYCGKDQLQ